MFPCWNFTIEIDFVLLSLTQFSCYFVLHALLIHWSTTTCCYMSYKVRYSRYSRNQTTHTI